MEDEMNKIEDEHVNSERIVRGFRHFIFRHIPVNIPLFRFPNRCGPDVLQPWVTQNVTVL
jgi:hypothetical protein